MRTLELDSTSGVKFSFGRKIRSMSKLGCIKSSKKNFSIVESYRGSPSTFTGRCSQKTGGAVDLRSMSVLPITTATHNSKIRPPVINPNSIDVIYKSTRPTVRYIQPRKPVRKMSIVINAYSGISIPGINTAHLEPCANPRPVGAFFRPCKNTRSGVVVQQLSQAFYGKISLSHDVVPCKQLIGQKPARVGSTGGLRYFTTRAYSWIADTPKFLRKVAEKTTGVFVPANPCWPFPANGALAPFNPRY